MPGVGEADGWPEPRIVGRSVRCDTTVVRAPIWGPRHATPGKSALHGRECYVEWPLDILNPRLTVTDLRVMVELLGRWDAEGRANDRIVRLSWRDLARAVGYSGRGDRQRQLIASTLDRLQGAQIHSAVRYAGGRTGYRTWSLVEAWETVPADRWATWVRISLDLSDRMVGSWTWVEVPILDQLRDEDEIAARLWLFLRAEALREGWTYPLFRAATCAGAASRHLPDAPPLAELLALSGSRPDRIVRRVGAAAGVVARHDPRYMLTLERGRHGWQLRAQRATASSRTHHVDPGAVPASQPGVPAEVAEALGRRHLRLTTGQLGVVAELLTRWTAPEGAEIVEGAVGDPLAAWMEMDRDRSRARLHDADRQEAAWATAKAAEGAAAPAVMAAIGEALARYRSPSDPVEKPCTPMSMGHVL